MTPMFWQEFTEVSAGDRGDMQRKMTGSKFGYFCL